MSVPSVGSLSNVQSAIAFASRKTGVDFSYLLGQAQVESGLRSDARSGTSSASGLYQFVSQSWLAVVKDHGAEHGLGWAADAIQRTGSGHYVVNDAATKQAILSLRNDPTTASLMAAEHASDNKAALEGSLGREATGTDLYMAHFLGLGGARSFLSAMADNPGASGASLFPAAARANRSVFYAADGSAKSLGQIYQSFAAKLDRGASAAGGSALASGGFDAASAALADAGGDVILGSEASADGDTSWIQTTMANLQNLNGTVNPLRPTPQTARLAYLMLASMGG